MEGRRHSLTHTHAYLQAVVKVTWNRHIMRKTENEKRERVHVIVYYSLTQFNETRIFTRINGRLIHFFHFPFVCVCVCVHSAYHSKLKQRVNEVYT